jgi:hypothetical protein
MDDRNGPQVRRVKHRKGVNMGIFGGLFGNRKREKERVEAKRKLDSAAFRMLGAEEQAKSSGGHPVCPKCGYKFPMSEEQIREDREASHGEGYHVALCPKCQTISKV